jgi:hypothetical protein
VTVSAKKPLAPILDKPESQWPCHCCSCHSVPSDQYDPKCHIHGEGHGRRGCVKHDVKPLACNCGCVTDPGLESARHHEMLARGERFKAQCEHDQHVVTVRTETTPEELAALNEAKREKSLAAHEQQQEQFQAAVDVAVQRALDKRTLTDQ